tara:strand:+ start:322 stop:1089 length:768 start_codon:yes stop_codon:yes gene_type:complete
MAKELPYFKFFCSEWNDGDITLEEMKVQGVFINVCSYYWSKECNLESKMLLKRFKNNTEEINILITEGHIKDIDGFIEINFLDEQLGERGKLSKQNSKNAKKRWAEKAEAERLLCERNANASVSQCEEGTESMQYREEKRREEKSNPIAKSIDFDGLLAHVNKTFGRNYQVVNSSIKAKYKARLKEGYTKANIMTAIDNASKDKFHKNLNYKHCTIEYFSRANTLDLHSKLTIQKDNNLNATVRTPEDIKNLFEL